MEEQEDIKVEVIDQVDPIGLEFTLYSFRCKICGRTFLEINNLNSIVNQAKKHLKTHNAKVNSIVIGKIDMVS
ncbi:MAG: hypothetical protein QW046_05680 [Candidatus Micrarchaeaceae archaeon]|uniref:hypothetical protein n=1 Tax=Saccharolobus sp. TaxID=2100761 RepID=UPI003167A06E